MKKATDIAKITTKGGFHLFWGLIVSTVVSAIGSIFIARLLGSDLYGLYTIALSAPASIAVFRNWNVSVAVTRCTTQCRTENRTDEIRSVFVTGLIFDIALGLTLSLISFALSNFIAATVFNRPSIASLIQIASVSILTTGMVNSATAIFVGMETMKPNNIVLIVQSVLKTLIVIILVILGLGTSGAVIGYTISSVFAGLIGVLLVWVIYKNLPRPITTKLQIKAYLTTMLAYSIPLSLSAFIVSAQTQFYTFLLPIYYAAENTLIGSYGISASFVVLISFFSIPITTMLFPAFSKFTAEKDRETLQNFFQYSVKYASLFVVPVAFLIICVAEPAVSTLFGDTYNSAPLFLALLAASSLLTAVGVFSMDNLIKSQGQTKYLLKLTTITAIIGFPMGAILILSFGVLGLIIASFMAGVPSLILQLVFVWKHYGVTVDWGSSIKILISSAIPAAITYTIISYIPFASWLRLVIGVIMFIVMLIPTLLFSRAINKSDINNLRELTSNFGLVTKLSIVALKVLEKAMDILQL